MSKVTGALSSFLRFVLTQNEANSRLVFLLQGAVVALCILIIVVAFVVREPNPMVADAYVLMLVTLLGGGTSLSVGRMFVKRNNHKSKEQNDRQPE